MLNNKFIKVALAISLGLTTFTSSSYAHQNAYKGFKYGDQSVDPYWLNINGGLKLDQRMFFGDKKGHLHNGASIREMSLNFSGGMGKDISVSLGLGYKPKDSKVDIEDAYITYSGFKTPLSNFQVSIGKVNSAFCLENTSSGKWIPFLERSSVTTAFRPDAGLGVSVNTWDKDYSANATISQPSPTSKYTDASGTEVQKSDRVQYNFRATKAHIWGNDNQFIQGGLFGHFKHHANTYIEFSSEPEAKSRHSTNMLLNTTYGGTRNIQANNHYTAGLELLTQNGPFSGEAEYQTTRIKRDKTLYPKGALRFHGYLFNANYVLTGESREVKRFSGTLGQVVPNSDAGAWEISGRYDYLNLNDKDVVGGAIHNLGAAATWYANYNFSVTAEYIRSSIRRSMTMEKLKLNTVGARLQLVF
jgi:phosphate-selective porin OprO/OprP